MTNTSAGKQYRDSEKGKATRKIYRSTYEKTEGYKARRAKYYNSEKGQATIAKYRQNAKYKARRRNNALKAAYGITETEYDAMFKLQRGCCVTCGRSVQELKRPRLHVDHNHVTGKVRELLCFNCNSVFGHVRDNVEILSKCLEYLKKHSM